MIASGEGGFLCQWRALLPARGRSHEPLENAYTLKRALDVVTRPGTGNIPAGASRANRQID